MKVKFIKDESMQSLEKRVNKAIKELDKCEISISSHACGTDDSLYEYYIACILYD